MGYATVCESGSLRYYSFVGKDECTWILTRCVLILVLVNSILSVFECSLGRYRVGDACLECPPGKVCTDGFRTKTCEKSSYIVNSSRKCQVCPDGTYGRRHRGGQYCHLCPMDHYCVRGQKLECEGNTMSYLGAASCAKCWPGHTCSGGRRTRCSEGTYRKRGSRWCRPCVTSVPIQTVNDWYTVVEQARITPLGESQCPVGSFVVLAPFRVPGTFLGWAKMEKVSIHSSTSLFVDLGGTMFTAVKTVDIAGISITLDLSSDRRASLGTGIERLSVNNSLFFFTDARWSLMSGFHVLESITVENVRFLHVHFQGAVLVADAASAVTLRNVSIGPLTVGSHDSDCNIICIYPREGASIHVSDIYIGRVIGLDGMKGFYYVGSDEVSPFVMSADHYCELGEDMVAVFVGKVCRRGCGRGKYMLQGTCQACATGVHLRSPCGPEMGHVEGLSFGALLAAPSVYLNDTRTQLLVMWDYDTESYVERCHGVSKDGVCGIFGCNQLDGVVTALERSSIFMYQYRNEDADYAGAVANGSEAQLGLLTCTKTESGWHDECGSRIPRYSEGMSFQFESFFCAPSCNFRNGSEKVHQTREKLVCTLDCGAGEFVDVAWNEKFCAACHVCEGGRYVSRPCANGSNVVCSPCRNTLPGNAVWTENGKSDPFGCGWVCKRGYSLTKEGEGCQPCTSAEACAAGTYLSGVCTERTNSVCQMCTNALPANGRWVSNGGINAPTCRWACEVGYTFDGDKGCRKCAENTCGDGEHLAGICSHLSNPVCTKCSGKLPENAMFGSDCEWTCGQGFTLSLTGNCTACASASDCAVGMYLTGKCSHSRGTECVWCTNVLPLYGEWISNGGMRGDGCEWRCEATYTLDGAGNCKRCTEVSDCGPGYFLSGECGHESNPECIVCHGVVPAHAEYSSECQWTCRSGYYVKSERNGCVRCTLASACKNGEYLGGVCSHYSNPACANCTNLLPLHAEWTSNGGMDPMGCHWNCTVDYTLNGLTHCKRCRIQTDCSYGEYLTGVCSASSDHMCTACRGRLPADATFALCCSWTCNEGFTASEWGCDRCRAAWSCGFGTYLTGNCSHFSNPTCVNCTNLLPADAVWRSNGGENATGCQWKCHTGYTLDGVSGCKQCKSVDSCGFGKALSGSCTHLSDFVCIPCSQIASNAAYTDGCKWKCGSGYWLDRARRECVPCLYECKAGEYLYGNCSHDTNKVCVSCWNKLPGHAKWVKGGHNDTGCDWICEASFTRVGTDTCGRCKTEDTCKRGQYLAGECTSISGTVCVPCTNALPLNAVWVSNGGTSGTGCQWNCSEPYTVNAAGQCEQCLVEDSCKHGQYLAGECTSISGMVCAPCTNALPLNAVWISRGGRAQDGCKWQCQEDYTREGTDCKRCVTLCLAGQYLSGNCTPETDSVCASCSGVLPENAMFVSECGWLCNRGYTLTRKQAGCVLCRSPLKCGRGMYLSGHCSHFSNGMCMNCTNKLPMSAVWVSNGDRDAAGCQWECKAGFTFDGGCKPCTVLENCTEQFSNLRGTCSNSSNPVCAGCSERLPADASFVTNCKWMCNEGYTSTGGGCETCLKASACVDGEYLYGNCSHGANTVCMPCTAPLPLNAHWVSNGGTSATGCEWECSPTFTLKKRSRCQPCTVASDCPGGGFLAGICSHSSNPVCTGCYQTLPSNSPHPSACTWTCNRDYSLRDERHGPKRIFQSHKSSSHVTPGGQQAIKAIRAMARGYSYRFYSDEEARNYIAENYTRALRAYDELVPGAYRADLFRYVALFVEGGVWLDVPMSPASKQVTMEQLLPPDAVFVSALDLLQGVIMGIHQAFLATTKGNPVLHTAIERIIRHVADRDYGGGPLGVTGPKLLQDSYLAVAGQRFHASRVVDGCAWFHVHRSEKSGHYTADGKVRLLNTRTLDYESQRKDPRYEKLYLERKVFRSSPHNPTAHPIGV